MQSCLVTRFILLTVTFPHVLSVEPGDPLPATQPTKVRVHPLPPIPPSNLIDLTDPNDDVPSTTKLTENTTTMATTAPTTTTATTTTTTTTTMMMMMMIDHRLIAPKNPFEFKVSPPLVNFPPAFAEPSISKHNLIRINRWKYEDYSTNEVRYWYEPDDGQMGKGWVFDTVAFLAYGKREPGTKPVFSFHSELYGEWTNTLQLDPMPPMIGAKQWIPDGISFYTYPMPRSSKELQPVWRYWNGLMNSSADEMTQYRTYLVIHKNGYEEEQPFGWIRDQILFYALPYEL